MDYVSNGEGFVIQGRGGFTFRHEESKDDNPAGLRKAAKESQALLYSLAGFAAAAASRICVFQFC